jgi:hypothetical protein
MTEMRPGSRMMQVLVVLIVGMVVVALILPLIGPALLQ